MRLVIFLVDVFASKCKRWPLARNYLIYFVGSLITRNVTISEKRRINEKMRIARTMNENCGNGERVLVFVALKQTVSRGQLQNYLQSDVRTMAK